ncbi:hypothetical protein GCM10008983_27110 [Lentibacillus halophilus]|uniref:Type IV pilus assembly protein PilO n=1 Tax=Lentibacillus halophilus TaxID=295065 RepID=A0ABP3JAZ7_9BACI
MPTNWNRSHTLILIVFVALAALIYLAGYRTMIQPMQSDLASTEEQVDLYEQQVKQLKNQDGRLDESLQQITEQVPADKKPDAVLNELRQMADKTNVDIDSISSSGAGGDNDSDLNSAGYNLDVTGANIQDVNAFLDAVQKGDRFMRIDSISIEQDGSADLSLALSTFYSG